MKKLLLHASEAVILLTVALGPRGALAAAERGGLTTSGLYSPKASAGWPVEGVSASDGDSTEAVFLSWSASVGATWYHVLRNTELTLEGAVQVGSTQVPWFADLSAIAGVLYFYFVEACGVGDCVPTSYGFDSGYKAFVPPEGVYASRGAYADLVSVTWGSRQGATYYEVWKNTWDDKASAWFLVMMPGGSYLDGMTAPGTTYWYFIKACSAITCSDLSTGVWGYRGLEPPSGVSASDGAYADKVRISWNAREGALGYTVKRNTTSEVTGATWLDSVSGSPYDDTTAQPGTTYWYFVCAYVGAGCGPSNSDSGYRMNIPRISGNAGAPEATLSYDDGGPQTVTADGSGYYEITVPAGWSGTVTPSKTYYTFSPPSLSYDNVTSEQINQDYTATPHTFADVPVTGKEWMEPWILAFKDAGITTGCGVSPLIYCPENQATRAEMAVFLERAMNYPDLPYTPPELSHFFSDTPVTGKEWMEAWVDEFYRDGITTGCGVDPLRYCPENPVTRAEMAVFILRAVHEPGWTPPAAANPFSDVPVTGKEWMEPWIVEFYNEGITTGCGLDPLRYCPENNVTRAEMAVFIDRAYGLVR